MKLWPFRLTHYYFYIDDEVLTDDPSYRILARQRSRGVYRILKSMEQGQTFRSTVPRYSPARFMRSPAGRT